MQKLLKAIPQNGLFVGGNSPEVVTESNETLRLSLDDKNLNNHTRLLQLRVKNMGSRGVPVNSFLIAEFEIPNHDLVSVLENGWGQSSFSGYRSPKEYTKRRRLFLKRDQNSLSFRSDFGYLDKSIVNEWFTQLVFKDWAAVIGAVTTKDQFSQIYIQNLNEKLKVRITSQFDGLTLDPGEEVSSEKIVIVAGQKEETLKEFGSLLKQFNEIQTLTTPPSGLCCAYYHQGNKVDEKYILEQLQTLDKLPGKLDINYIQIDAGYSPWGDWLETGEPFSSGMGFIVNEIKKRGMRAGIWIAPFVASPRSKLFKEHNEWFLKDGSKKDFEARFTSPIDFLPFLQLRALDVTHPQVQNHLDKIIRQFVDWGFEFIKTDFTYPVCFSTNYHTTMTRAQALRLGFEVIRKAAGNKVHLMSSLTQISPLVGLVDSARVGLDTLNPFVRGIPVVNKLVNNWMLEQNLRNCETRQFLNGIVWVNDADCLVFKQGSGISDSLLTKHFQLVSNYGGSRWIGDHLGKLGWDKYEKYVLDLFEFTPNKKPAISVVIPAWNEEKVVQKTIHALTKQETKIPFEVVFVDNNCTDNTVKMVEAFEKELRGLKIICEKNQGIGAAREAGFSNSEADIIASTDADTIVPPEWISKIWDEFWKDPHLDALVGTYIFETKSHIFNFLSKRIMILVDHFHRWVTGSFAFRGLNFAVKKSAWKKAGGFNPKLSALEDVDLSLRVGKFGKIKYLPNFTVITTYRRFEGRFLPQLMKRARAYIYRVILKNSERHTDWEAVR